VDFDGKIDSFVLRCLLQIPEINIEDVQDAIKKHDKTILVDLLRGEDENLISYVCKLVDQDAAYPNLSWEFKDLLRKWFYDYLYQCALEFEKKAPLDFFEHNSASKKNTKRGNS